MQADSVKVKRIQLLLITYQIVMLRYDTDCLTERPPVTSSQSLEAVINIITTIIMIIIIIIIIIIIMMMMMMTMMVIITTMMMMMMMMMILERLSI